MVLAPATGLADATPDAAPDDLLVEHAHEVLRAVPGGRLQPATAPHGEEQWTATEVAAADATAADLGPQLDAEEQAAAMRSSKKKKKKKNRHRGKSGGRACGGAAGSTTAAAAVKATADALPSLTEKKKTSKAKLKLGRCAPVAEKDGLKQLEEAASAFTAVGDEADEEARARLHLAACAARDFAMKRKNTTEYASVMYDEVLDTRSLGALIQMPLGATEPQHGVGFSVACEVLMHVWRNGMTTVMVNLMGLDACIQWIAQNIDATLSDERCYSDHGIAPGLLVNKALRTISLSLARCERTAKAFATHSSWDRV